MMSAGLDQVIVGVALSTLIVDRGGGGCVIGRVGGREGDRERLTRARGEDRARGRRIGERSRDTSATPPTVHDDVASSWVADRAVP